MLAFVNIYQLKGKTPYYYVNYAKKKAKGNRRKEVPFSLEVLVYLDFFEMATLRTPIPILRMFMSLCFSSGWFQNYLSTPLFYPYNMNTNVYFPI